MVSNTKLVNVAGIVEKINGATFMGIDTLTSVKLKGGKKNPFQGRVTKQMVGAVVESFTNKNSNGYANMVNRRLEKEGKESFTLGSRAWGTRIDGEPVIVHTNKEGVTKHYLEMIFIKPGKVTYFVDGIETPKEEIEGLDSSEEGKQGSLEDKVIIRSVALENITGLRVNKQSYTGTFFYK